MATLNQVNLIGNLTREVELKTTPRGTAVAQFGIAINRTYKDESGQEKEEVTFLDIETWGKTAEIASKYLRKGAPVFLAGRLKLDQWEDKESKQKRSRVKVVAENIQFLGSRSQEQQPAPRAPREQQTSLPQQQHADDDVPF